MFKKLCVMGTFVKLASGEQRILCWPGSLGYSVKSRPVRGSVSQKQNQKDKGYLKNHNRGCSLAYTYMHILNTYLTILPCLRSLQ